MAKSLFDKARIVVQSQLHKLLDKQVNTVDGYKQLIRDLEGAIADVSAGVDEAVGTGNGYKRQLALIQSQIAQKQSDIDLLLGDDDPTNDESAVQLQLEVERLEGDVTNQQSLIDANTTEVAAVRQALTQLQAKHQKMLSDLSRLTQTQAITVAKNRAAGAVEAATEAASVDSSVDSIAGQLDHDADVANARFDRVVGGLQSSQSPEEAAALARAKAAIAARRSQLTQAAQQTVAEPASV